MKLLHVVGARPNFPKVAPVVRAGKAAGLTQYVVHTGQHYDDALSASFFRDLDIPEPDCNLAVGSGSHAAQTARIMERIEPVFEQQRPDWVVVYGDVNSTMAAAIVAAKLDLRVAHVEAGLRSYDRSMPEEINRIVTDRLAQLLLAPSRDAVATLRAEGEPDEEIVFVGNVMVDSLMYALTASRATKYASSLGLAKGEPIVVTLHRPSNVDDAGRLAAIVSALRKLGETRPVIWPAHPRTKERLASLGIELGALRIMPPVRHQEMLNLLEHAFAVVTDSGGIQEETTALGVPCFTLRENTERPITIDEGTNQLVKNLEELPELVARSGKRARRAQPEGWDGKAGIRVIAALTSL